MSSAIIAIVLCVFALHQAVAAFSPVLQQHSGTIIRSPASPAKAKAQLFASAGVLPPPLANLFVSKDERRSTLKREILDLASATKRGLTATDEQKQVMEKLFTQLEALNPTRNPLIVNKNKPSINGDWSLDYTTSDSILGKGGFPRVGPIIQNIDTTSLSAKNSEIVRYFYCIDVPRSVSAELSPVNGQLTYVKFKKFKVGPLGFDAPDSFRGSLDITYLDDEMRLTRGDKGNIFVLTRL